jgi:hypothetical protein
MRISNRKPTVTLMAGWVHRFLRVILNQVPRVPNRLSWIPGAFQPRAASQWDVNHGSMFRHRLFLSVGTSVPCTKAFKSRLARQ